MKKLIILTVIVFLFSCSPFRWVKEGVSQYDQRQDETACKYEAEKAIAPSSGTAMGLENSIMPYVRVFSACMEAKGYRKVSADTP